MTRNDVRVGAPLPVGARSYQGRRAGVVTRVVANSVDFLVVLLILGLIYAFIAGFLFLLHPHSFKFPSNFGWSIPVIGFGVALPYLTFAWYITGRTYGDVLLGLRVVTNAGRRPGLALSFLRAFACVVFPIGVLWVAVSRTNKSVQDILVRTSVIYDWRSEATLVD
jgi:uncharacterized RDD family membrane protein YckC